jgi:ribonuclease HI
MTKEIVTVFADGAARGNPGPASCGVVLRFSHQTYHLGFYLGETTNNVAEYQAVIAALTWLHQFKFSEQIEIRPVRIDLHLDSELVIRQLSGEYRVKANNLKQLHLKIKTLEMELEVPVVYIFVRREKNQLADRLANEVLDLAEQITTRNLSSF